LINASLSRRLSLSLAASLALFFLLLTWVFNVEIESLSEKTALSRMQHDMDNLLAAPRARRQGLKLSRDLIDSIYNQPLSGHYYQLNIDGAVTRSRSLWDSQLPAAIEGVRRNVTGPMGQHLLMLTHSFDLEDSRLTLTIAEDMSGMYHEAARYQKRLLLVFLIGLVALLAVQLWAIRRGLSPLKQVPGALRKLEQGDSSDLQQLQMPAEIAPLASEVNRLLLVMQERLARSRVATGNLAHALKTPLAVIRSLLEGEPGKSERNQIGEQADKIHRLIDRELSRARLAGDAPGGFWPEPGQDLRDLATMLEKLHPGLRIDLQIDAGLRITADREDMLELLGNLLDNAGKWSNHKVVCSLEQQGDLLMTIEDDGPGISNDKWNALLQRGQRSDESKPGHGLGLAIVRDIVDSYRGTLEADQSGLGGLRVKIRLPLAQTPG